MRKWTIRQFEWYRDNNNFNYYRLNVRFEAVFYVIGYSVIIRTPVPNIFSPNRS